MKLLTKRLLAVAITAVMTIGMTMTAMAGANGISDSVLEDYGLDPDKTVAITGWIDVEPSTEGEVPSDEEGTEYASESGEVDLSGYADLSQYTHIYMAHKTGSSGIEMQAAPNGVASWDSFSPFCLVGEKKSSSSSDDSKITDDDDDDDSSSSSSSSSSSKSSSSKSKSPKTGMNDSWMMWLIAAGVLAGASVVSYNRKRG